MRFKYDPPALIDLTAGQTAQGACYSGSVDTADCGAGTIAACIDENCSSFGGCARGGWGCMDGGTATTSHCRSGSSAGDDCACGSSVGSCGYTCGGGLCNACSCGGGSSH